MIERIDHITLSDFVRLYEQSGPFELIDGEMKPLMPPVAIHGLMIRALFRLLDAFCTTHHLGEVITEMPFVLLYDSNWVRGSRVPDVMFFAAARWADYLQNTADWQEKPFILVPDLAIEVVSPNDLYTEIQGKVERYLADGVRLIWVIDPQRKRVTVYEGSQFSTIGTDDILTGGDIIPDLAISLADLFKLTTDN
jgi:Uma2 family endonuclease